MTKRNTQRKAASTAQPRLNALSRPMRVRQRAKANKDCQFDNLFSLLTVEHLRNSFNKLNRKSKAGNDGVTWYNYQQYLETNLVDLHEILHSGRYRAQPVVRTYIKKKDGSLRPLGVTALEDKLVQQAISDILGLIYENDFLGFSYGYRPARSAHDALDALNIGLATKKVSWVLDADLKAFFDTINHDYLIDLIKVRVTDKRILRLLKKWLKTGWIEDGQRHRQEIGTPQGSVISPMLANIFLHYVQDEWALNYRDTKVNGDMVMIRYADDSVFGFQYKYEAETFLVALRKRLGQFGLTLHPAKTRLIEFGRYASPNRKKKGQSKPETFDFLGFTHICAYSDKGIFWIKRVTCRKGFKNKLAELKIKLRRFRHKPLLEVGKWLNQVISGHQNYFAVPGNMDSVKEFYTQTVRLWLSQIRKRSQKGRKKWTWERFRLLLDRVTTRPRCVHPFPSDRFGRST